MEIRLQKFSKHAEFIISSTKSINKTAQFYKISFTCAVILNLHRRFNYTSTRSCYSSYSYNYSITQHKFLTFLITKAQLLFRF